MLEELSSTLPLETYIPWSFLFASALLATSVDAFAKRPFNPVTVCVWFFGLTFSGTLGAWGLADHAAAFVCLLTPHLLISMIAPRLSRPAEDAAPESASDVAPPDRLVIVRKSKPKKLGPFRRAA